MSLQQALNSKDSKLIARIFISEDKMHAYLDVVFQNENSDVITHNDIERLLTDKKVIYGYTQESLKKAALKCKIEGGLSHFKIAEGREASPPKIRSVAFEQELLTSGKNIEKYKHEFSLGKLYEPEEYPKTVSPLIPGQEIGKINFAEKGQEKVNIYGEKTWDAPDMYPYNVPEFSVEGNKIFSSVHGFLYMGEEGCLILPFQNDFEFSLNANSSKMELALNISPSKVKDRGKSSKNIVDEIKQQNIKAPIHYSKIGELITSFAKDKKKVSGVICQGEKAVSGRDGEVNVLYNETPSKITNESANEKVDFKSHNSFVKINENTVLATIQDPVPGKNGKNIYGETVEAPPSKPAVFNSGEGTYINPEDDSQLLAKWDGIFQIKNNLICVVPVLDIKGHVDFESGDINFNGDVVIGGDIKSGFKVTAKSLNVSGSVEDCLINASADVRIKGGFVGEGKGKLVCPTGNLELGFLHNQTILCGGNVTIYKECFDAKIKSAGRIHCNGEPVSVVGGSLCGYLGIKANVIGNETGLKTIIEVGKNFIIEESLEKLKSEMEQLEIKQRRLMYLSNKLIKWPKNSEYKYLISKSQKASGIVKRMMEEKSIKIKECNENLITKKDVGIKAGKIFPGVILNIKGEVLIVPKLVENVELKLRNNRIVNIK